LIKKTNDEHKKTLQGKSKVALSADEILQDESVVGKNE